MVFGPLVVQTITKTVMFFSDRVQVMEGKSPRKLLVLHDDEGSCVRFLYPEESRVTSYRHETGSISLFKVKRKRRVLDFTIDVEENVGSLSPKDAVQHVIAQMKGSASVKKFSEGQVQVGMKTASYATVEYKEFEQQFQKRIVAFYVQDDDMCIVQMSGHKKLLQEDLDLATRILQSIEPHQYHGRGFLALFLKNFKLLLPSPNYIVRLDPDFLFQAHLRTNTGTIVDGITLEKKDEQMSLTELSARFKYMYQDRVVQEFQAGPFNCVMVSYEGEYEKTKYKFADIGIIDRANPENEKGDAYILNAYTKPARFDTFEKTVKTCVSTLRFFAPDRNNRFFRYFDYEREFKIKIPLFMKIQELDSAAPFLRFYSKSISNSISMTVANAPLPKIDPQDLQSESQDIRDSVEMQRDQRDRERQHQITILKREMLHEISSQSSPFLKAELIHTHDFAQGPGKYPALRLVFSRNNLVSGEKMVFFNTFIVATDCRIFRIQSCSPGLELGEDLRQMFVNIHESIRFI